MCILLVAHSQSIHITYCNIHIIPFLSHPPVPVRSIPRCDSDRTVHFFKKRDHMTLQVKGVVNKRQNIWKIYFLDIQQVNSVWSQDYFSAILLWKFWFFSSQYQFPVFGSPNILPEIFPKFSEIFPKISRKFLGKLILSHIFTLPIPHNTHPHPHSIIQTVNSLRTSDPFFSKTYFYYIYLHVYFPHPSSNKFRIRIRI